MKNVNKEDVMSKAMMAYVANDHYYYPSAGMSVTACRVKRVAYGAQNETYIEGWEKSTSNLLIYKRLCKI